MDPALCRNAGFDPVRDSDPISFVATAPYVLVVNFAVPAWSVSELIAWIKAQPKPVNHASAGNGTLNHLFAEMLRTATGLGLLHIRYKTVAASLTDVVSGPSRSRSRAFPPRHSSRKAASRGCSGSRRSAAPR